MQDILPPLAAASQRVDRYSDVGFHVAGVEYTTPVVIFPTVTQVWDGTASTLLTLLTGSAVEFLILGTGAATRLPERALREALSALGIRCEAMRTDAACRTYNILLAEGRPVAAALVPLSLR